MKILAFTALFLVVAVIFSIEAIDTSTFVISAVIIIIGVIKEMGG